MGRDKAFVEIDGESMVGRVAAALRAAGIDPLTTVGGDEARLARHGLGHLPDRWPGEGPLGGLLVAVEWCPADVLVAVGCDMPWLDAGTVAALVAALRTSPEAVVAVAHSDRRQPLCAAWRAGEARRAVASAFTGGQRSVRAVIERLTVVEVAVDAAFVRDVDRPADVTDEAAGGSEHPERPGTAPPGRDGGR